MSHSERGTHWVKHLAPRFVCENVVLLPNYIVSKIENIPPIGKLSKIKSKKTAITFGEECTSKSQLNYVRQVSFKKEVGVMVNDLVFWLTVWLNFENVLLTFKWYVFMWQKCSMLTKYANCHFFNKWKCVSMALRCYDISMNKARFYPPPSIMSFLITYSCQFKFLSIFF